MIHRQNVIISRIRVWAQYWQPHGVNNPKGVAWRPKQRLYWRTILLILINWLCEYILIIIIIIIAGDVTVTATERSATAVVWECHKSSEQFGTVLNELMSGNPTISSLRLRRVCFTIKTPHTGARAQTEECISHNTFRIFVFVRASDVSPCAGASQVCTSRSYGDAENKQKMITRAPYACVCACVPQICFCTRVRASMMNVLQCPGVFGFGCCTEQGEVMGG